MRWLGEWYSAFFEKDCVEPLFIVVREAGSRAPIMILPLIKRRNGRLVSIEAPDSGITDYVCPLIAEGTNLTVTASRALWRAIRKALPKADLIWLTKLPASNEGEPNPLAVLANTTKSSLTGNILTVGDTWSAYHWGLERRFRKEIERSWRVFERQPETRFEQIKTVAEAIPILSALERRQSARFATLGHDYLLDEPKYADFYRNLVKSGLEDGSVRLTALMSGSEVVAALLGIARGPRLAMIRLATGSDEWRNCSPGRLIIYKTMEAMHTEGFRIFDYTIGDYSYKRRLGAEQIPLYDLFEGCSPVGWPVALLQRLRSRLRKNPILRSLHDRMKQARPTAE